MEKQHHVHCMRMTLFSYKKKSVTKNMFIFLAAKLKNKRKSFKAGALNYRGYGTV